MNEFLPNFLPQLTQQLINGLSLGSIYALIAIGYTMVYGIIGMINFA
ncbi:MAG TPA: branched-chain amino acid ABC transporter permease LivH, partial [Plasticicumulans sp.]|nr:branched-chain amino acid ABC transporter permease LivH [Plasticicumulans sp.]HNG49633.1 branched-chain amino acid ABC transporter permease LivH [Plasticicumulans sp.]